MVTPHPLECCSLASLYLINSHLSFRTQFAPLFSGRTFAYSTNTNKVHCHSSLQSSFVVLTFLGITYIMSISPTRTYESGDTIMLFYCVSSESLASYRNAIYRINIAKLIAQFSTFKPQGFSVLFSARVDNPPGLIAFTFRNKFSLLIWEHTFFVKSTK